jgi:hypothetical protein
MAISDLFSLKSGDLVHFFAQKSFIWVALDCLLEQKYTQKGKKEH